MHQWDIVALHDQSYALILQADLLDQFAWRVAAPLVPAKTFAATRRLHLPVRVARRDYIVVIDKMASIQMKSIAAAVGSMKDREWDIRRALDLVFVGV